MTSGNQDDRLWEEALGHLLAVREHPDDRFVQEAAAQWRNQSAAHHAAWNEAEIVWSLSGEAKDIQVLSQAAEPPATFLTRRRLVTGGLGFAAAAGIALIIAPDVTRQLRADVATGTGEIRRIDLPDGSVATLGPDSALGLQFTDGQRQVELLGGMAYFEVPGSRASSPPFRAVCREMIATASDAAFELSRDATLITAAVDRGRFTVGLPQGARQTETQLDAGQWVSFDEDNARVALGRRDREYMAAWRRSLVVAEREPVHAVVAKVARWYGGKIIVAPGLGGRTVSGIFDLRDPLAALEAIAAPFDGKVHRLTKWLAVIAPV